MLRTDKNEIITEKENSDHDVSSFGSLRYKQEYDKLVQKKQQQREKSFKLTLIFGIAIAFTVCVVCASVAFVACIITTAYQNDKNDGAVASTTSLEALRLAVGEYDIVSDNIVQISSSMGNQLSGLVITSDGYILTSANQELKNGNLTVNGEYDAHFVGMDEDKGLAVLKIDSVKTSSVEFGKSDALVKNADIYLAYRKNGEDVVFKGNIDFDSHGSFGINGIQFDNCMYGAAVFDANGHVVGIVTGGHGSFTDVMSSSDALPFIRKYVRNVLSNGISCDASSVEILGVSVVSVSDDESEKFGLPGGLLVVKCDGESTGENAGLMVNDIIIGVNSFAVENADTLDSLLKDHNGQTVSLLVYRNERYINIGVNVDA